MDEFSRAQALRWKAWQHAYAISARRSDHIARLFGLVVVAAMLTAIVVAILR
jgi:hypothetical protein